MHQTDNTDRQTIDRIEKNVQLEWRARIVKDEEERGTSLQPIYTRWNLSVVGIRGECDVHCTRG